MSTCVICITHIVAVLKLRNCDNLKELLLFSFDHYSHNHTSWCRGPRGSPMKITAEDLLCKVYGNKSDDSVFLSVHVMLSYCLVAHVPPLSYTLQHTDDSSCDTSYI